MIQLSGAGKRFGHKLLYDNLNWLITPNERSGLVGGNGTGKSTLLKVIGGESRDRSSPETDTSSSPFSSKDAYDYATTSPV